ncbi:MAG: hypothetical protein KDA21_06155 [Phycisphaerales bacterium]|nr:hypothetical protein [Phycisphaerales bacterium]
MSIRAHLILMIACEFLGFMAGAVVGIGVVMTRPFGLPFMVAALALPLILIPAVMLPRVVFRRLIAARCPNDQCRGPAYATGSSPIRYVCRRCGHDHETAVSEADEHNFGHH